MIDDKVKRAMMAADLAERAARNLREGLKTSGPIDAFPFARALLANSPGDNESPETKYRHGLRELGTTFIDIDAAVAAILDGKHPPDSLPGKVAKYHATARDLVDEARKDDDAYAEGHAWGCSGAARWVLSLLGCEVKS